MKTFNHIARTFILAIFGTMIVVSGFAKKPAPMSVPSVKPVETQVKEAVKYPDFKMDKEDHGSVVVTFLLTDDGAIQIEKITAPSEKMENYVREQLSNITLKDVIHPYNQLYKVSLKFAVAG